MQSLDHKFYPEARGRFQKHATYKLWTTLDSEQYSYDTAVKKFAGYWDTLANMPHLTQLKESLWRLGLRGLGYSSVSLTPRPDPPSSLQ